MSEDLKNNDPMQEKSAGGEVKSAAPEAQAAPETQAAAETQTAPEMQATPEVQPTPETQTAAENAETLPAQEGGEQVCRVCGVVNPSNAKYCNACGSLLSGVAVCPACGAQNLAGSVFCNQCGAKLSGGAAQAPLEPETENTYESKYTGGAFKRLLINLGVLLGTLFTLGIAYPFLVCIKEKWLKSHTFVNGRQLEFDGNGAQLIGKYIIWLLLSFVTFGIYALLRLPLNMQRWKTKHTHVKGYRIDGKKGESKFTGSMFGLLGIRLLRMIMFPLGFITLGFASAWAKLVRLRWFNEKKIIDGVRIHNDAQLKQYWVKRVVWVLLMLVTVFFHRLFIRANSELKFLSKHDKFANPSVFPRPEELAPNAAAEEPVATPGTNSKMSLLFVVLTFLVPIIPLIWPILANVFAAKARKGKEANAKMVTIVAAVILALQIVAYIAVGITVGVILGSEAAANYMPDDFAQAASELKLGMSETEVTEIMGSNHTTSFGEEPSWGYTDEETWEFIGVTFDADGKVTAVEYDARSGEADIEVTESKITPAPGNADMEYYEVGYYVGFSDGSLILTKAEETEYTDISLDTETWVFRGEWQVRPYMSSGYFAELNGTFSGTAEELEAKHNATFVSNILREYRYYYAGGEIQSEDWAQYEALLEKYGIS